MKEVLKKILPHWIIEKVYSPIWTNIRIFCEYLYSIYYRNFINKSLIIRPKSTDLETFGQVFFWREYAFRFPFRPRFMIDAGANGFIWRKVIVEKYLDKSLFRFEETNLLNSICSKQSISIANIPGKGIYHYYCETVTDYARKRKKIAGKFLERKNKSQTTWVDRRGRGRLIASCLFLISVVGPLTEAVLNIYQSLRIEWLWHPVVSALTVIIYFFEFFKSFFKKI